MKNEKLIEELMSLSTSGDVTLSVDKKEYQIEGISHSASEDEIKIKLEAKVPFFEHNEEDLDRAVKATIDIKLQDLPELQKAGDSVVEALRGIVNALDQIAEINEAALGPVSALKKAKDIAKKASEEGERRILEAIALATASETPKDEALEAGL